MGALSLSKLPAQVMGRGVPSWSIYYWAPKFMEWSAGGQGGVEARGEQKGDLKELLPSTEQPAPLPAPSQGPESAPLLPEKVWAGPRPTERTFLPLPGL